MGFRKFQSVEKTELVSKQGHDVIEEELRKTGKASVRDMDADERATVTNRLDDVDNP